MRNDTLIDELRQARPVAPSDLTPPSEVCEQILAASSDAAAHDGAHGSLAAPRRVKRRRRTWLGWSTRTVALVAGTLTLTGAATAATLIVTSAPTSSDPREVVGPIGYVAYWEQGKLARITDCSKTPGAVECQGERTTTLRIQDETMEAVTSGRDKGAAVLFLNPGGRYVACAGVSACSYVGGEPNAGKPLPRIGEAD